ncbi:MAG: D-alanyl-D-alanine carboxypeptidase family protein [Rhodanobacter sp.]|jgi:D-alanyl-D-alanine carboxypeptidase/D-alanyl-D-alanine carboxypeptidase (penicillin-binding protein 5/6)
MWAVLLCGLGVFTGVAHAGYASIVIDGSSGKVLNEVNADEQNYPASLTKMMTLYLAFQGLKNGTLQIDQQLAVSPWAAAKAPTKLGLRPGETISVSDCILAMVTKSANDAATVVAEGLGGTESQFANMMNAQAALLGMSSTHFDNASGLPDPRNKTTARDLAKLAMALYRDFPQYDHYFSTKEFMFRGQLVRGHNHLMDRYPGMDGLKTGFTDASGFNLASTAVRDGHRLFAVVLGGRTAAARDQLMARLLDDGFDHRDTPAILVAEAAGVNSRGRMTHRVLAALSPIGTAEAEPVPVSAHHHRRGKREIVARAACSKHRRTSCPVTHHLAHQSRHTRVKLARRVVKKPVLAVASTR